MNSVKYSMPFVVVVFLLAGLAAGCADYGKKLEFNKGEVYFTEGVDSAEAQKLGKYLVDNGFFDGKEKSVQLQKKGDRYIFRAVMQEEYLKDENMSAVFQAVGNELSHGVFNDAPVDVELTDEHLETQKTIPFNPTPSGTGAVNDTTAVTQGADSATGK